MRNTLLKPILSLSVLMGASGCFTQGYAEDIVIVDGLWKISYIENDHAFRVNVLNEDGSKMSFHTFRFRGGLRQSGGRVAYCDACIFCRHKTDRGTGK